MKLDKKEKAAEEKIREILANVKLTPFQRLWLKDHKPDIYKYLPEAGIFSCSEFRNDNDLFSYLGGNYPIPDSVIAYIDEVGDLFSTRKVKELSNWKLKRIKYGLGESY